MLFVVLCTLSGGFVLDSIWNYNVLHFVLCCVVVLCTVCGGFVFDIFYNYYVLQFVLFCVWCCVQ